ncbi:MAG: hypothetical protein HQ519_01440 [Planctomycetes bacterium]|nr:hypothetical protein [Planctomycetota bacterium]
MSHSPLPTIGLAALVSVVTAAVTVFLFDSGSGAEKGISLQAVGPKDLGLAEREQLLNQVDQLLLQNQQLSERIKNLEGQANDSGRSPTEGWVTQDDLDALKAELAKSETSLPTGSQSGEEFETRVATAMDSIREKEVMAKVEKGVVKKAERLESRVGEMSKWLNLDASQTNQIRTVLASKDHREQELISLWKNGSDKDLLGQIKKSNEEVWKNEVKQVLTAEQLNKFNNFGRKGPGGGGRGKN